MMDLGKVDGKKQRTSIWLNIMGEIFGSRYNYDTK
jgi:hypothetical protein